MRSRASPMHAAPAGARYAAVRRVGAGSFGVVYEGRDTRTGRPVALKKVTLLPDEPLALRELHVLRCVEHENVVALLDYYADGSDVVLVLEWCGGGDVSRVLDRRRLQPGEARAVFAQLLRGLRALHGARIVHRDVKPANLLVCAGGRVVLGDFGLAALCRRVMTPQQGSRWYRAPEVLLGAWEYGAAADMWSAGCVLVELLSGAPPVSGHSDIEQAAGVLALVGPEPPRAGRAALPDADKFTVDAARCADARRALLDRIDVPAARDLVGRLLLTADADARPTAADCLRHPFVADAPAYAPSLAGDAGDEQRHANAR